MHKIIDYDKASQLYQSGLSLRQIAKQLNTNHTSIRKYLDIVNVPRRSISESQKGKPRPYAVKPMAEKPCAYCGNPIRDKPGHLKRRKYCSNSCKAKAQPHPILNRPILTCEWCGKQYQPKEVYEAKDRRFCCHNCSLAWNAQNLNGHSKIEKTVCEWLTNLNIPFNTQVPISQFFADIVLQNIPLVIECDGSYWHNLPGIPERDRMRNIIMRRLGYSIIRLDENDINKRPDHCIKRINRLIKKLS